MTLGIEVCLILDYSYHTCRHDQKKKVTVLKSKLVVWNFLQNALPFRKYYINQEQTSLVGGKKKGIGGRNRLCLTQIFLPSERKWITNNQSQALYTAPKQRPRVFIC